jgi:hypothetical protein
MTGKSSASVTMREGLTERTMDGALDFFYHSLETSLFLGDSGPIVYRNEFPIGH